MYEIESGIKAPRRARATIKPLELPLKEMKQGQSIFVPFSDFDIDTKSSTDVHRFLARIRANLNRFTQKNPTYTFSSYKRTEEGRAGVRIFRVNSKGK